VDTVLEDFVAFLSRDIEAHPDRLKAFGGSLREPIEALVGTSTSISTRCYRRTINDGADARGAGQPDADQASAGQY
jgi:hypothetical protein